MTSNDYWLTSEKLNVAFLDMVNRAHRMGTGTRTSYFHEGTCIHYPAFMNTALDLIEKHFSELREARRRKCNLMKMIAFIQSP